MIYFRKSLIFFTLLFIEFSSGKDTLSTGQTLKDKDGDFLISVKKTFTLGFFRTGIPSNRYLGICYSNDSENKLVWVANRDNPVTGTSGVLSFHTPNSLVIHGSQPKEEIWTTGFLGTGKNYSAQLLDTGNLVVYEEAKKGVISWQSFDHPTDTWLPKMRLGVDRKTGSSWSLTSWKSYGDPGTGKYSLRMDVIPRLSELSIYQGSKRIWRTGPLNGDHLGQISPRYIFNVTYVDNEEKVYVTYDMRELTTFSVIAVIPNGFITMSELNPDMLNWTIVWTLPKEECDDYNQCGPNRNCEALSGIESGSPTVECLCFPGFEPRGTAVGCVRKRDRNVCQNGEGFIKFSSMKMPDTTTAHVDMVRGLKECKEECLRDCNCTAYSNVTEEGIGCVMWYGDLLDTRKYKSGGQDLFIRVDAVELAQYGKKQQRHPSSNKKRKVAAVVTSVGVVAFTVVFILCWLTYKRKGGLLSRTEQRHGNLLNDPDKSTEQLVDRQKNGDLPFFDLISLVEATNNFSHENKLGQGGFGSVYKGTLKNGQEIAVKRLSETSKQGLQEF